MYGQKTTNVILGSLLQAEESAGLEKCHHRDTARQLLHWLQLPYLPVWSQLTARPAPVGLCTASMEQAEADKQAEARPHLCSASSPLSKSTVQGEEDGGLWDRKGEGGRWVHREETKLETRQQHT